MRNFPRRYRLSAEGSRFRVVTFTNPSGNEAFRVTGWTTQGRRIRENYPTLKAATARRVELENEFLRGQQPESARVTTLTADQLRNAETAFTLLSIEADPGEIVRAARYWLDHGRHQTGPEDAPRLDDAAAQWTAWLPESGLRPRTQATVKHRVNMFSRRVGNPKLGEITPDFLDGYFGRLKGALTGKDASKRALSSFFNWCMERPRRWMTINPAKGVRVLPKNRVDHQPAILSVEEAERVMRAAESVEGGRVVPWFALGLFGGLRPAEAARLAWEQVNLVDGQIRLEAHQTKTGSSRVVDINPPLRAWLEAYQASPMGYWQTTFRDIVRSSGVKWTPDVLRHTAATALLRIVGKYADVARELGNSEAILRKHYEGRMSSTDAQKLFALRPTTEAAG